jgi:hypothetical protein
VLTLPSYFAAARQDLVEELRSWIATHPNPSTAELAHAGFVAPDWPRPWGREADMLSWLVIDAEFHRAGLEIPRNAFGTKWVGPSLLAAGTPEQKARYLWPLLTGEESWCRLHSEPDAGTDLSMISTRATITDGGFLINGQKVWTANAARADFGAVLARTSGSRGDGAGVSYIIVAMSSPGITVRPIKDMAGRSVINEVFLDDVFAPSDNVIGELGRGLQIRLTEFGRSRMLFHPGMVLGHGPSIYTLSPFLGTGTVSPELEGELLERYLEAQCLDGFTMLDALGDGDGPTSSAGLREEFRDLLLQRHSQRSLDLVHRLRVHLESCGEDLGDDRFAPLDASELRSAVFQAPFQTIAGGTSEMHQEAIVALLYGETERAAAIRF